MAFRHPIYDDETEALRAQIRRFCEKEIRPHMEAWEEAVEMPREVYQAAAEAGLLGVSFPEEYGSGGRHHHLEGPPGRTLHPRNRHVEKSTD